MHLMKKHEYLNDYHTEISYAMVMSAEILISNLPKLYDDLLKSEDEE